MNTTDLLQTGHIALWLLIAGLFFPRLSLVIAWLTVGYKAVRAAMANPVKSLRAE